MTAEIINRIEEEENVIVDETFTKKHQKKNKTELLKKNYLKNQVK